MHNVMNGFEEEKFTSLYFIFKAFKPHFNLFLKASNLSTEEFLYLAMRECYRVYAGQVKNKRKWLFSFFKTFYVFDSTSHVLSVLYICTYMLKLRFL